MDKSILNLVLKLLGFSIALFGVHYYIISQLSVRELVLPLWVIYAFNAIMVFIVFSIIKHYSKGEGKNMLNVFLILTIVKMALAVVLLLPLFLKKSDHTQLEVFNFFIPYFLFLTFEIFSLNKFLQKS